MRRRTVIAGLGCAAVAAPFATSAQRPALPIVGYISGRSQGQSDGIVAAFRQGLKEGGFVEGENVVLEYRFADGDFDRLPALTAELVHHEVNVIAATGGTVTVVKAKPVVPTTLPMVFAMGGDPVKLGVVASLNRPGSNITGVTFLVNGLAAKDIELLHEIVPKAAVAGFLINPNDPNAESDTGEAQAAAKVFGQRLVVAKASTPDEIDAAFEQLVQQQVTALLVDTEPFLTDQRAKIIGLAARHAIPAVYQLRDFVADGGLASYGTSITDANRQLGAYTGRVLRGTKPADLPVIQSSKFELVINLKTAKALGLTIPPLTLLRADEVIE
jgi:putative tryptophan/tyrosine transport system substrate-binding protein